MLSKQMRYQLPSEEYIITLFKLGFFIPLSSFQLFFEHFGTKMDDTYIHGYKMMVH